MPYFLAYDTETTGLPDWSAPSEAPHQPHIVQLGARLIDLDTRRPVLTLDTVIKPSGWVIPDEVASIHGITTEVASRDGIFEDQALAIFDQMWRHASFRLAFNESFDMRILRIAYMRYRTADEADAWKAGQAKCSAKLSTPICALPPTDRMRAAGRYHHKTPNLGEAFRHFFGRDLENAHTAIADVDACAAIYFAIQDMQSAGAARSMALIGGDAESASANPSF